MQLATFGGPAKAFGIQTESRPRHIRPQQHWHYAAVRDLFQLAAIYVESFATTQHFVDGNKRVALHSALLFLRLNGYRLEADPSPTRPSRSGCRKQSDDDRTDGRWFAAHSKVFDAAR